MERLSPAIPTSDAQKRKRAELSSLSKGILENYTKTMKKELGSLALYLANLKSKDPFEPKCPEAWELYRPLIEELWHHQNLPLRELTARMRDDYNFKASEKQFRDHTRKWNLRKYNKAPKLVSNSQALCGTPSPPHERHQGSSRASRSPIYASAASEAFRRQTVRQLLRLNNLSQRILPLHQTPFERLVECGLVGMRDYVYSHSEQHDEWKRTNKFDVIISQGPFFLSFNLVCAALVFYYQKNYVTFGKFIQEAFGRMQENLHSINPGLIVEALLHVPFLLLTHGPPDLLCHYIYHLACYAHLKLKGHPIYHTIMAIASSLYRQDAAEHLRNWICTAAQLWEDIYSTIRGPLDKNAINAYSERLYISDAADEYSVCQLVERCRKLHEEATTELGPTHILTLQLQRKGLAVQSASSVYLPDFPARAQAFVDGLEDLRASSDEQFFTEEYWDLYRKVMRWIGCYWFDQGKSERAMPYWEKCLEGPFTVEANTVWVLAVLDELEQCYRSMGLEQKRKDIQQRRVDVCETIKRGMLFVGDG